MTLKPRKPQAVWITRNVSTKERILVWGSTPPAASLWMALEHAKVADPAAPFAVARCLGANPTWAVEVHLAIGVLERHLQEAAKPKASAELRRGVGLEYIAVRELRGGGAVVYHEQHPRSVLCSFGSAGIEPIRGLSPKLALDAYEPSSLYVIPEGIDPWR